ncbi:hypothetical protein KOR42_01000 [Thalassoglobus neptunius]|uniref:Uncharacterized protein n=1 Tax=Thalassoglobus neptunius TaxID=1938619 RepID=A0A5C5X3J5_9PLAN|nr:hypothetical protein KOR42_01000 [Thalassoglobus neptunius]
MLSRKKSVCKSRKKLSRDSAMNLASDFYHGLERNARLPVSSRSIRGGLPMSAFLMFGVSPKVKVFGGCRRRSHRRSFSEDTLKESRNFEGVLRSESLKDACALFVFVHRTCFHSIKISIHSFPVCSSFFISTPDDFLFTHSFIAKDIRQSLRDSGCRLTVCSC